MTDHVSRCPNCETSFIVSAAQLEAADGAVRCGACLQVFNAADYFVTAPIADLFADEAGEPVEADQSEIGLDGHSPEPDNSPESNNSPEPDNSPEPNNSPAPENSPEPQDSPESTNSSIQVSHWEPWPESQQTNDADHEETIAVPEEAADALASNQSASELDNADSPELDNSPEPENGPEPADNLNSIQNLESKEFVTPVDPPELSAADFEQTAVGHEDSNEPATNDQDGLEAGVAREPEIEALDPQLQEKISEGLPDLEAGTVAELEAEQILARGSSGLRWIAAVLVLAMIGAGQYAWFERSTYALHPDYRGYYETACNVLNCSLPEYSDVSRLRTQNLVVRSHPTADQGLVVDALLRNEAAYRQQFPGLYLRFSDIRGQTVAERTFKPSTYLAGEMAGLRYIPAATEVRLSLEIVDPGEAAVSYSMVAVAVP